MEAPNLSVTCTGEARKGGLAPTGKVLFGTPKLASLLSPYGVEPTSEEPPAQMPALLTSDRAELDEILGEKARILEMRAQERRARR